MRQGTPSSSKLVDVVAFHLRPCDLFARIGGEEFAILLPGSDHENSLLAAERVREAVAAALIEVGGLRIPVTVSLGVSALAEEDEDIALAVSRADQALYRAKAAGRNRVHLAEPTSPGSYKCAG
jgi:diguanylate cyclase (GGDEF)-like protein